jgi:hypothetical protein
MKIIGPEKVVLASLREGFHCWVSGHHVDHKLNHTVRWHSNINKIRLGSEAELSERILGWNS